MTHALLPAAITAVLKRTLENALADPAVAEALGGEVLVSTRPLDQLESGAEERSQLNLFLFHVSPNSSMRQGRSDGPRSHAVDLHYCVSAHGSGELAIETLLGVGLDLLTARPALERHELASVLAAYSASDGGRLPPPAASALARSRLAERIAGLRLEQQFLSLEEASRLWSASQARYRPALYLKATVALLPS